jgi:predicted ribosome quality control (RQC) complex YloA/Tae2 family protein
MTRAEIAAAVAEAVPAVVGGVVVRVRAPWPHHLALEVRARGRNVELLFGVAEGLSRIHLARDLPPSPPNPGAFNLRARKALRPGRVVALEPVAGERIVVLSVSPRRESDAAPLRLVAELFGRGRMFLLDGDGRVVAWDGPGGPRGLAPGAVWTPPPLAPPPPDPEAGPFLDAAALEARYLGWMEARERSRAEAETAARLAAARRRLTRRIRAMEGDLAASRDHAVLRREGELLATHRQLLRPGMTEVRVTDWFADGAPERAIALDPARTPEENVAARFDGARKGMRAEAVLTSRLEEAHRALERLDAGEVPPPPAGRGAAGRRRDAFAGVRRFRPAPGWEIWVGSGAAGNERLTFQLARGNDLWFHAHGVSGAHVILRAEGEPPPEAIRQAALLAAHFSRLKAAGGGEVACTRRQHVRRVKGAAPGTVAVSRERVLPVRLDPDAVARLLKTRAG